MSKSIMHRKEDKTCYLCMKLHHNYSRHGNLEEHHVMYGGQNRRLSEKYGLKVYLCINHHTYDGGPEAVHRNDDIRRMLEKDAQRAFERAYEQLFIFMTRAPKKENGDVDFTNPVVHEMANPNYGVTIRPEDMLNDSMQALNDPQQRKDFLAKSLNVYTAALKAYFNALKAVWKEYGIAGRQPARPFLANATRNAEETVLTKMQEVYKKRMGEE